jgi:predicted metal-dependent HD superfamily phosphohydrolase
MRLSNDRLRFRALWRRNLVPGAADDSGQRFDQLIAAYNEPQRVYHTQRHIEDCLELFGIVQEHLDDPDAVEFAIWYHDVVYEIGARDNEQLSANLFMQHSDGIFPQTLRQRVYEHIMATLHCERELGQNDTRYVVDIDLSSFGMPWDKFFEDSRKVRAEMNDVPDEEFYANQCTFQQALLNRGRFYQSDYFYRNHEQTARDNIADYFAQLKRDKGISCC